MPSSAIHLFHTSHHSKKRPGWRWCSEVCCLTHTGCQTVPRWRIRVCPSACPQKLQIALGTLHQRPAPDLVMSLLSLGRTERNLNGETCANDDPELQKAPSIFFRWDAAPLVYMNERGSHWHSCGKKASWELQFQIIHSLQAYLGFCLCLPCRNPSLGFNLCKSFFLLTFKHGTFLIKYCE